MKYKILLTSDANAEESEAYAYYENARVGLGVEFLDVLKEYYNKIAENPLSYSFLQTSHILRDI